MPNWVNNFNPTASALPGCSKETVDNVLTFDGKIATLSAVDSHHHAILRMLIKIVFLHLSAGGGKRIPANNQLTATIYAPTYNDGHLTSDYRGEAEEVSGVPFKVRKVQVVLDMLPNSFARPVDS